MMMTTHEVLGKCKAMVHPHTNQLIATPYACTRKAVRDGFCTQHHKIAYGKRLVPPLGGGDAEACGGGVRCRP